MITWSKIDRNSSRQPQIAGALPQPQDKMTYQRTRFEKTNPD